MTTVPTLLILLIGWPVVALVVALARRAEARRLAEDWPATARK